MTRTRHVAFLHSVFLHSVFLHSVFLHSVFLLLALTTAAFSSVRAGDNPLYKFTFGVEGPDTLFGAPGETVRATYFLTLTHEGRGTDADVDCDGQILHLERGSAYIWFVQVTADRAPGPNPFGVSSGRIQSIGPGGTDGSACGLSGPGAAVQVQVLGEGLAYDCEGLQSAWTQVTLPYTNVDDDVRRHLPFNRTSRIARLVVEFEMPRLEGIGTIRFIDGCRGSQYRNALRMTEDELIYPELEGISIALVAHEEPEFRRGDANTDGVVDISDGILVVNHLFIRPQQIDCQDAADANDDGNVDISDGIGIFAFLFVGGYAPPSPGPHDCGQDPTRDLQGDPLSCALYDACPTRGR